MIFRGALVLSLAFWIVVALVGLTLGWHAALIFVLGAIAGLLGGVTLLSWVLGQIGALTKR